MDPKPTARQLAYLRSLALSRGQTFVPPRTRREASAEIDRLRFTKSTPRHEQRFERLQVSRDLATRRGDSAAIQDREVTGYGSTATWAQRA
jgi:hypothetical protein